MLKFVDTSPHSKNLIDFLNQKHEELIIQVTGFGIDEEPN